MEKCKVFTDLTSDQLLAYVMANATTGVFVGFFNKETKEFDLSTFYQLRHVHPEAMEDVVGQDETDLLMQDHQNQNRDSV